MSLTYVDFGRPLDGAAVKAAGMSGICRYLSNNSAKNLSWTERDDALAHGLDIVLVWETTTGRSHEGAAAGTVDGHLAAGQAIALRAPKGMTLYAATDEDVLWPAVAAYHFAFNSAVAASGYVGDVYGGYWVVLGGFLAGAAPAPWQTRAWSGTPPLRLGAAALYQYNFHTNIGGNDTDANEVQPWVNGWRAASKTPPPPVPVPIPPTTGNNDPGEIMQIIRAQGRTAAYLTTGIAHPMSSSSWSAAVHEGQAGMTVEIVTVSPTDYDAQIPAMARVGAVEGHGKVDGLPAGHEYAYDPFTLDSVAIPDTVDRPLR